MKLLGKIFWSLNVIVTVALLLSYVSPVVDPIKFWPLSFFGLFYPVFLTANVIFLIYWLITKPTKSWLSLISILVGWNYLMSFATFNSTSTPKSSHVINVMSYNIQNAGWAYSRDKAKRAERSAKFIKFLNGHNDVDVLCTQETGFFGREMIAKGFKDIYKHKLEKKGATIWSKFPLGDQGEIDFGTNTNSCVWADVILPADTIRVYSAHLYSNNISKDAVDVLDNVNLNEKETWSGIGGILAKYKNANVKRSEQAKKVKAHMSKSPFPVILTGDFNDPPSSFTYSTLSKSMSDAFCEKGLGISSTYGGRIPFLRIDYIMTDDAFDILDYDLIKNGYSDHYPIRSRIILKKRRG